MITFPDERIRVSFDDAITQEFWLVPDDEHITSPYPLDAVPPEDMDATYRKLFVLPAVGVSFALISLALLSTGLLGTTVVTVLVVLIGLGLLVTCGFAGRLWLKNHMAKFPYWCARRFVNSIAEEVRDTTGADLVVGIVAATALAKQRGNRHYDTFDGMMQQEARMEVEETFAPLWKMYLVYQDGTVESVYLNLSTEGNLLLLTV